METEENYCHGYYTCLKSASARPGQGTTLYKIGWQLRKKGWRKILYTIFSTVCRRIQPRFKSAKSSTNKDILNPDECLNLQPGDWVEVKSIAEIKATLDESGCHRGLLWMPTMSKFCDGRYRVLKRAEHILLESTGEIRTLKNTVLLKDVFCNEVYDCDRTCFHFWREAWLRKINDA